MRLLIFTAVFFVTATSTEGYITQNTGNKLIKTVKRGNDSIVNAVATAALAVLLSAAPMPASATSTTAGQITLNSIPPTSVQVDIQDLPVVGNLLSGTYTKVTTGTISSPSITITSPKDKLAAVKAVANGGHLEFDFNGLVTTHFDIDIAANEPYVATVLVESPLIPKLPFKNKAVGITPKINIDQDKSPLPAFLAQSSTAGQIYVESIPPTSIQVDIEDLPIIGKVLSGTYTKVEDNSIASPSVSIHSPSDKLEAVKNIASGGHLEFDIDGVIATHLDIDIAANQPGVATVRVESPLIPKLPFQNKATL